jgi:hypothetical protein
MVLSQKTLINKMLQNNLGKHNSQSNNFCHYPNTELVPKEQ